MIRDAATFSTVGRMAIAAVVLSMFAIAPAAIAQTASDPHLSHTRANFARGRLACTECHAPVCTPNQAENVAFGELASKEGARPAWDPATKTCSGVYCHGSTLAGAPAGSVAWTYVDMNVTRPLTQQCIICHGYPPASHDAGSTDCGGCHASASGGAVNLSLTLHVDGKLDVSGGGCGSCHGNPPATGAHVAHYGLVGGSGLTDKSILQDKYSGATPTSAPAVYAFGCGNCHPSTSHKNGTADVVLYDAGAPAGSLMSRSAPTAAYDRVTKTCSDVYCHSTGQATPGFKTTPGWFSGTKIACGSCHDNPPAYASGGPGSATANSHLGLADDGYEFGHFLGMPGAWHTTKHGGGWGPGEDTAPITCQTCHFDTTDPSNTGPSGFYYLDTSGNYRMPGGDPGRISWGWQDGIQCGSCHSPGDALAPTGTGKVLPLRHVNGTRDVVFDSRASLPAAISWIPAAPNTPTLPYWITNPGLVGYWPAGVTSNGTTISFGLGNSTYDPQTKTCTNVACHVAEQQPVWGRPYQYYTNQSATCYTCHPM